MNYLEYQVTIEDPKVLTKPWTSPWETLSLSANNERLSENFCADNENVEQLRKLYEEQKKWYREVCIRLVVTGKS